MEEKYKELSYHLDGLEDYLTQIDNLLESSIDNFETNIVCDNRIDNLELSICEKNIDECRYNINMIKSSISNINLEEVNRE